MTTDDTQPPDDRDINRLQGIPDLKVELRPVPDAPGGHHLLFVDGQQISGFGDNTQAPEHAPDNDDAPSPVADWTSDCDGRVPNQRLIRLGKAFVELREGVLSEGQLVQMTGLDRITVREIDDLFNQAVTGLEDRLNALVAAGPTIPAEPIMGGGARLVYVALDAGNIEAIGNTKEEARAGAVERRGYYRDQARSVGLGFHPAEGDEVWSDGLRYVAVIGSTEDLGTLIRGNEDFMNAAPWCPQDLWDSGDVAEVTP